MANFAVDAAMAVALANTLFFAAASGESKSKVALYLLITIAPFAVIAPLIGPALDRVQHGRRVALAMSFVAAHRAGRGADRQLRRRQRQLPVLGALPVRAGMMVLSKSFSVLRSAMTPRVLPPTIDLVRVNSRLTMFGLLGGTIVGGGIAAGVEYLFNLFQLPGALYVVVVVTVGGAVSSMRIPKWVEVTEGEVPTTLTYHGGTEQLSRQARPKQRKPRQPMGRNIITSLWGNCTIKVMVGFLFLYPAFVAKSHDASGWEQLRILGLIGAAAAIGNFAGNFAGARLQAGPSRAVGGARHDRGDRGGAGRRGHRQPDRRGGRHAGHLGGQRDRQGVTGRLAAGRPARGVARVGVRPFGVGAAAGLGGRRRDRRAGVHRAVGGLHGHHRRADPRPGADDGQLQRRLIDPRLRRQPAGAGRAGGRLPDSARDAE